MEDRRRGLAWAMTGAFGGGFFVIPWKLASEVGESADSALILLTVAAIANTLFVVGQHFTSSIKLDITRTDLFVAALLAAFTLFGNLASARAIQDLSPALLNVLLRAEVILVALLGWILLGERVEGRFWFGAFVAVCGLILLQGPFDPGRSFGFFGLGTGAALVGAACFSSMAIVTRHFIHRIHPVTVNALRLWMAVGLWFAFNAAPGIADLPPKQILYAGLAALAGPFFGRLCIMLSSRYVEARISVLASLATPVITLFLALVFLSDWPERFELVGGAIMIVGIAAPFVRFGRARSPGP